jgi:DNA-binding MarR family transcriptional regulator
MKKGFIKKFREILRKFDREIFLQNNASCCNGISLAQCHTLLEIEKNSEISVTELARSLSLDKSTVSRTVDGLVNIKMVDRVIPKENRRLALAKLTDSGQEVCSSINYTNDSYIRKVMYDFTAEEREEFLRLFSRLTNNMKQFRGQKEEAAPPETSP